MQILIENLSLLLGGLRVTLIASVVSTLLMFPTAFALGVMRCSDSRLLRGIALVIVDFFRGGSGLIYLFWVFYVLPQLGISLPPFTAGVLVIGIMEGSYASEVVRAGLQSVPPSQRESAQVLGLSKWTTFWRVVLPQALPVMVLPFGNMMITLLKYTAILSLVTVNDFITLIKEVHYMHGHTVALFGGGLLVYYAMALCISGAAKWVNDRVSLDKRKAGHERASGIAVPAAQGGAA